MDATKAEAPELVLGEVDVLPRGEVEQLAPREAMATREAMAARYDALAETDPIYAGMWRAQARILRRAPAEATANPAAAPAKGGAT